MKVARYTPGRADRSDARRERCAEIARRRFPTAHEINVRFFGPLGVPFAEVWHADDGHRRAGVHEIQEPE